MKKATDSNMFGEDALNIEAIYGSFISGNLQGTVLVLGNDLSPEAQDALEKSFKALGFGTDGLMFVRTQLPDGTMLGAIDVRTIIEGLDPLCCVITEQASADLMGKAYRTTLPLDERSRIFGRSTVAFRQINAMLDAENEKQRLWALLKTLVSKHQ